ncbi:MAG TPA: hypothetical protein VN026_04925 [Bacteroidia bacterium]|jgi:hypothetical protein|nr:hypothetical protein [Bacteroidia bacterium]
MYSINDKQIDYILNDIRRRGVEMEDLQSNLLDHICCIVEQNLDSDGDFEDFYKKTIPKFFKHELWEIEEETILLLTYKNYYTMKKAMIYGGVFSLSLIALGTAFKIFHWPGAGPTMLLGFIVLCFVFFPAALYLNYNPAKKNIGTNLAAFLGGTFMMIGIFFKIMHWPGTPLLLISGWTILLAVLIPLLLFSKFKENIPSKEKRIYALGAFALILFELATLFKLMYWPGTGPLLITGSFLLILAFLPMYSNMQIKANKMSPGQFVFVITLSMFLVALTSLMTMNVYGFVLEQFSKNESDNIHIIKYFEKKKEKLLSETKNDSAQVAQIEKRKSVMESAAKTRSFISTLKIDLVEYVENVNQTVAKELLLHQHNSMNMKINYDRVNDVLFSLEAPNPASNLKTAIESYRSTALKLVENNNELTYKINRLLNTDPGGIDGGGMQITWEEKTFRNNMLISTLARLSDIEKNICIIETEVLNQKN